MKLLDDTFNRFSQDLKAILHGQLHDVVIHGSTVLGDFRPHKGDIDYIVITEGDLTDEQIGQLFRLHDQYRLLHELLLDQLEGVYYPRDFLLTLKGTFGGAYIGTGRSGWRKIDRLANSLIDLRIATTRGISLLGRPIKIYNPTDDELLSEMYSTAQQLSHSLTGQPTPSFGYLMSIVHWCARTLIFLQSRGTTSKATACRWAATQLDPNIFGDIFLTAENERYPYNEERIKFGMQATCTSLLQLVAAMLPGQTGIKQPGR